MRATCIDTFVVVRAASTAFTQPNSQQTLSLFSFFVVFVACTFVRLLSLWRYGDWGKKKRKKRLKMHLGATTICRLSSICKHRCAIGIFSIYLLLFSAFFSWPGNANYVGDKKGHRRRNENEREQCAFHCELRCISFSMFVAGTHFLSIEISVLRDSLFLLQISVMGS